MFLPGELCLCSFTYLSCFYPLTTASLTLPNGCFCYSSSSWTAVFNAMPTICFGFQVSLNMRSSDIIDLSAALMDSFEKTSLFAVPCQLRAGVQQHEQKGDKILGSCRHSQHDNLPLCLHRNRYNEIDYPSRCHRALFVTAET